MLKRLLIIACAGQAACLAASGVEPPSREAPPSWLENSRWLRLDFSQGQPAETMAAIQRDLELIQSLGFNAIYLAGWNDAFPAEALRALVTEAHVRGLKLVAELELVAGSASGESKAAPDLADFRVAPERLESVTSRWTGGVHGGELRDGLDGWSVANAALATPHRLRGLRSELVQINPAAVLIAARPGDRAIITSEFDSLFDAVLESGRSACLVADHASAFRDELTTRPGNELRVCCPCPDLRQTTSDWQVATTVRFLAYRMPMLDAAELNLGRPENGRTSGADDDDFGRRAALVHLLASQHAQRGVLHHGEQSWTQAGNDELLTFERAFRNERVVVAVNAGASHREVTFTFGEPRQWVGVLTPQLEPPTSGRPLGTRRIAGRDVPVLMMTGTRLRADEWGDVTLPVDPYSARILLDLRD